MENKIKKEIEYMLEKINKTLESTDNKKDREKHLVALGENMALNDLKYSIIYDNWRFDKEE